MEFIKVDQTRCVKCGICMEVCPTYVLSMGENGPVADNPQVCIACGQCVAVCPHGALNNRKAPLVRQEELDKFPVICAKTAQQFIRSRRSIRSYKEKPVPRELLIQLLDIGRFAQTAGNRQGISYLVVEEKERLKKAVELVIRWMEENSSARWSYPLHIKKYKKEGIDGILRKAPHLIIAAAPKELDRGRENTILSFSYMELFANTLGLGSCFAGLLENCAFSNHRPLLDLFQIPDDKVFTGALLVGYPKYNFKRLVDRNPLSVTFS